MGRPAQHLSNTPGKPYGKPVVASRKAHKTGTQPTFLKFRAAAANEPAYENPKKTSRKSGKNLIKTW
jgi:hypothetical protein